MKSYDVVVIGAGHAGCEAALAASRLGCATALITLNLSEVGKMPCNPSIGGPGKSQIVKEIDALGGEMARVTDAATIHIRMLNTSKGRAMQVRRAQADRSIYKGTWKRILENAENLELIEGLVDELLVSDGRVTGVRLREGPRLGARAVVVATGTFLNGRILIGDVVYPAGRGGEPPSVGLAESLRRLGLEMGRMKTGTTPRVNRRSVDYSTLDRQDTSPEPLCFSFWNGPRPIQDPLAVYVTHTNEETHRIIRENLHKSANYNGLLEGVGPRHCPSLESKIVRFPERTSHKVFLEPEGRDTAEVYLQGIYTAFSPEVQEMIVHSIEGLEEAQIERYGYDIEYDYVNPIQLSATLEIDGIGGLYLAGQINGTTGYEEAAGQGLIAGINAARKVRGKDPLVLHREEAMIGVMIDDLVTKGVTEPYRMLPSRAEYRITLREGNADLRLARIGYEIGLLDEGRYEAIEERRQRIEWLIGRLRATRIGPTHPINARLSKRGSTPLADNGASLFELLRRPEVRLVDLIPPDGIPADVREEVEIEGKYAGYLAQQRSQIERLRRMEEIPIPDDLDYHDLTNISIEGRELLSRVRPRSFGQASRIPGISQADLSILAIVLRR